MDKHGDKGCLDETVEYSRANLTNKQQCHISRVSFTWGNLNYLYLSNVIQAEEHVNSFELKRQISPKILGFVAIRFVSNMCQQTTI